MFEKVLSLFSGSEKMNFNHIKKALDVSKKDECELTKVLNELELSGTLYQNEDGIYGKFPDNFFIADVVFSQKGNPQIHVKGETISLNPKGLDGILPNDTVIFERRDKGFIPIKVLKRGNPTVVCEVKLEKKKKYLEVCNSKTKVVARIDNQILKGLSVGERVLVNLSVTKYGYSYQADFIKRIGHRNDFDTELNTIAINNGFFTEYPESVMDEISQIPDEVSDEDRIGRKDKRQDLIFTIDGEHTKDIDDAVELKVLPNGNYLLTVSIAHVSHYVKPGSALWEFAQNNTTSLYLIDSVLAMLHSKLSNGICSLNPDVDRLARSFEMEITPPPSGNLIRFSTYPSVIHSRKKMTYEDVNLILEKGIVPPGYEPYVENLKLMEQFSNFLTLKRKNAGGVDFSNKEISFSIEEDGKITKTITKQGPAQKIIENFMVLTNSAVGSHYSHLLLPFVYRNHELPMDDIVRKTYQLLKNFGYKLEKLNSSDDSFLIQKMIRSLANKEEFEVLSVLILQSMQRAYYSHENHGHFGLALDFYSQSTSPIRRFLDLVIHTLIDYYDGLESDLSFSQNIENYLEEVCKNATQKERCADKAEYEANQLYMAKYMLDHIGEEFFGYISDINSTSISIKTDGLIDGYAFVDLFPLGFVYYPESKMMVRKKDNTVLHIGSKLKVKVSRVDLATKLIEFDIIEPNLTEPKSRIRKNKEA